MVIVLQILYIIIPLSIQDYNKFHYLFHHLTQFSQYYPFTFILLSLSEFMKQLICILNHHIFTLYSAIAGNFLKRESVKELGNISELF